MVAGIFTRRRRRRRFGVLPRGTYAQIMRPLPQPGTQDHLDWIDEYIEIRYAQCVQPRPRICWISPSIGNDSLDDSEVSEATPFATWGRASQFSAAAQSGIEYRFRRGEEHFVLSGSYGVQIPDGSTLNYSITDYGDDPRPPRLHRWTTLTGTWTNTSGNVWKQTGITVAPAWIIEDDGTYSAANDARVLNPFTLTNSGSIAATSRSWYYVAETDELFINLGGTNPNFANLRWISSGVGNNISGIYTGNSAADAYIRGLRIEGFGAVAYGATTGYGINTRQSGTAIAFVEDCECYYNGNHAAGHISTDDGVCIQRRIIGGHDGIINDGGHTTFVGYCSNAGLEYVNKDCIAFSGGVPHAAASRTAGAVDRDNTPVYGHTGDVTYADKIALFIVDGLTVPNNTGTYPRATYCQLKPAIFDLQMEGDDTDLSTIRAFFVRCTQDGGEIHRIRAMTRVAWHRVKWLNVTLTSTATPASDVMTALTSLDVGGFWFDCEGQFRDVLARNVVFWPSSASITSSPKMYRCHWEFDATANSNSWTYSTAANNSGMTHANCIISDIASGASRSFNFNAPEAQLTTCAFWGTPTSGWASQFDGGTGSVTLTAKPIVEAAPVAELAGGTEEPDSLVFDVDARGNPWFGFIGPYQGA